MTRYKALRATLTASGLLVGLAGCSAAPSAIQDPSTTVAGHVGALNPAVTQADIAATICRTGWTATVRPPASYTNALKSRLLKALPPGVSHQAGDYELDHIVPLEVGGAPRDPTNLALELWPEAHVKDTVENRVKAEVCAHTISLSAGQACFQANWHTCP